MAAAGMSGNNKPCVAYSFASQDQYLFQPVCMATQQGGAEIRTDNKAPTVTAAAGMSGNNQPVVCYQDVTDCHILDDQGGSQVNVRTDGKSPTLRAEMHGNVPCVMEELKAYSVENHPADSRVDIDRADTAGCNGKGWKEDTCYTLNTIDRPDVVYAFDRAAFNQGQNAKYDFEITDSGIKSTLISRGPSGVAYLASGKETVGTLMACAGTKLWLDNQAAFSGDYRIIQERAPQYIVRRLTPTECARLQGFADRWGDIDKKDSFNPEEYRFWLEVRNTHAAINGKAVKEYTEAQMLTWYNKLHTDSAEYKMWGNGIALPPALYCMQGMVDVLQSGEADDDSWLL